MTAHVQLCTDQKYAFESMPWSLATILVTGLQYECCRGSHEPDDALAHTPHSSQVHSSLSEKLYVIECGYGPSKFSQTLAYCYCNYSTHQITAV